MCGAFVGDCLRSLAELRGGKSLLRGAGLNAYVFFRGTRLDGLTQMTPFRALTKIGAGAFVVVVLSSARASATLPVTPPPTLPVPRPPTLPVPPPPWKTVNGVAVTPTGVDGFGRMAVPRERLASTIDQLSKATIRACSFDMLHATSAMRSLETASWPRFVQPNISNIQPDGSGRYSFVDILAVSEIVMNERTTITDPPPIWARVEMSEENVRRYGTVQREIICAYHQDFANRADLKNAIVNENGSRLVLLQETDYNIKWSLAPRPDEQWPAGTTAVLEVSAPSESTAVQADLTWTATVPVGEKVAP